MLRAESIRLTLVPVQLLEELAAEAPCPEATPPAPDRPAPWPYR